MLGRQFCRLDSLEEREKVLLYNQIVDVLGASRSTGAILQHLIQQITNQHAPGIAASSLPAFDLRNEPFLELDGIFIAARLSGLIDGVAGFVPSFVFSN